MRNGEAPVHYLVGTPKGRLTRLEKSFVGLPWREVRESVEVKLLTEDGELYILAQSRARILKERGMRRRRLSKLWRRLQVARALQRDALLLKLGDAPGIWSIFACPRPHKRDPEDLHLRVAARPAAPRPAPRGPLPAALQSRARIRRATTCGSPRSSRRSRSSSTISPSRLVCWDGRRLTFGQMIAPQLDCLTSVLALSCGSRASVLGRKWLCLCGSAFSSLARRVRRAFRHGSVARKGPEAGCGSWGPGSTIVRIVYLKCANAPDIKLDSRFDKTLY